MPRVSWCKFSANKMDLKAYEDVSQHALNVAAQQKIAHGVEEHGFGDAGAMMFGAAFAQGVNPVTGAQTNPAIAEQPVAAQRQNFYCCGAVHVGR